MAKEKKPVHKVVMTEGKREVIRGLLNEYDIETANDIQEALKDFLGSTLKEIMGDTFLKIKELLHFFSCQGGAVEIFVENTTDYLDKIPVI